MAQRISAFVQDGIVYYSPNSNLPFHVPPPRNPNDYIFYVHQCDLINFLSPSVWSEAYRWLPFVPIKPIPPTGLFTAFSDTHPVAKFQDEKFIGYGLRDGVAEEWEKTEDLLFHVYVLLAKRLQWTPPVKPTPIFFLRPRKPHMKRAAAKHHIGRCSDWISMWVGLVSYTIAHTITATKAEKGFSWFAFLAENGIPQPFLDQLRVSIVCEFSRHVPRVGVVLDWLNSPNSPPVDWLIEHHIPVWFPWTEKHAAAVSQNLFLSALVPQFSPQQMMAVYCTPEPLSPLQHAAQLAHAQSDHDSHLPLASKTIANPSTLNDAQVAKPQPGHRGNRFLSEQQEAHLATIPWKAHFITCAERNKLQEAQETPQERQQRVQRAAKPSTKKGNGYKFYVWEWDDSNSILVRKQVQGQEIEEIMDCPRTHRRFDAFSKTWEVCEFFGDEEDDQEAVRQEARTFAEQEELSANFSAHETTGNTHEAQEVYAVYNSNRISQPIPLHDVDVNSLPVPVCWNPPSLHSSLRLHHGFLSPLTVSPQVSQDEWERAMVKISRRVDTPIAQNSSPIVQFIDDMCSNKPPANYDLQHGSHSSIAKEDFSAFFSRQGSKYMLNTSSIQRKDSDPEPPAWFIVVEEITTAIIIYRLLTVPDDNGQRRISCLQTLAGELVSQCISFHTLLPTPNLLCSLSDVHCGLPFRVAGYKFTQSDYHTYQDVSHSVLSNKRGRAALLVGGIVTRIAMDRITIGDAVVGPSPAVVESSLGVSIHDGHAVYSDDDLTKDELDVICGMYSVLTGRGAQESRVSWWPPCAIWQNHKACGVNMGYWTEANELWYQERKRALESGSATPLNSTEWRALLRKGQGSYSRAIVKATELCAREFFH